MVEGCCSNRSFKVGDIVIHTKEEIEGKISDTNYGTKFKVKWEDGFETLESFHTVELK